MIGENQKGFTLVELLAAILLMGMTVVGITNLFITIEVTQRRSYNLVLATRAGEKQIESLRNSQYGALEPDSTIDFSTNLPADLPSPKSGSVYVSEPEVGLRRVDVTIAYKEGSSTKTIKQSSFIGIIGIGQ
ncbi:MAG: prepilin-type N-terminal cleavage/methylation domain-containing protein [bacterium]|nr:prepilin-type N-terminal cleavage/methylation domain-containing protein [bacterium]